MNSITTTSSLRASTLSAAITALAGFAALLSMAGAQAQTQTQTQTQTAANVSNEAIAPAADFNARPVPVPIAPSLKNLTTQGATVADGDKLCPDQPYYLYSGGKPDNYAGPADAAYPSPNLMAFIPSPNLTVAYDVPMVDGRFGDSFNLQNTRGICHAVVQFRAKPSNGPASNDGLTFGHVGSGGTPFTVVAQVINPAAVAGVQSYALTAAGRAVLAPQTGYYGGKAPADSVLDLYLQDDTELDFFRMLVWYAPPCKGKACRLDGPNSPIGLPASSPN